LPLHRRTHHTSPTSKINQLKMAAIFRIENDLKDFNYDDYNEYIAYAKRQDEDPLIVEACLIGPKSTPYEDDTFIVKIKFSDNYPVKKQKLFFINFFI